MNMSMPVGPSGRPEDEEDEPSGAKSRTRKWVLPVIVCSVFFLACSLSIGSWALWNHFENQRQRSDAIQEISTELEERTSVFVTAFEVVKQQIRIAAETTDLQDFRSNKDGARNHLMTIIRNFFDMSQVRILDLQGMEVIRIQRESGGFTNIGDDLLQDKSSRYYFQNAVDLRRGEVFISHLDLNVENGEIERPWVPTVRFVAPIFSQQREKIGFLVFNINMSPVLRDFQQAEFRSVASALINTQGYWLAGMKPERLWGFMTGSNVTVASESPDLWQKLQETESRGSFVLNGRIYMARSIALTNMVDTGGGGLNPLRADESLTIYVSTAITDRLLSPRSQDVFFLALVVMLSVALSYLVARLYRAHLQAKTIEQGISQQLAGIQRMASLGRIVAGVAHELRTPIGNARTAVTALGDNIAEFDEAVKTNSLKRSYLDAFIERMRAGNQIVERNIERSVSLIGHFKQTAADQTNQRREKFDLGKVLSDLCETLRLQYKKRGYELELTAEPGLSMQSYPGAIDQIILNLLQNAEMHAFREDTKNKKLMIRATSMGRQTVRIEISDNGKGIPPDHVERIFEPFWTTRRGGGGTGLGLSIVANIVQKVLEGDIRVSSVQNEGTIFVMTLPRTASEKTPGVQGSGLDISSF